jgi:hypothetical protein
MPILFWLYLLNLTLLILHEMDSAYWREWELFRLPGGEGGFVLIHLPLFLIALYGVVWVWQQTAAGLILSLVVSAAGLAAFGIHTFFLRQGRSEFDAPVSRLILWAMLITSLAQAVATMLVLCG